MAEEFRVGDRVRIIKGKDKGKSGDIVGKSKLPWEMWEEAKGQKTTLKDQKILLWDIWLGDIGEMTSLTEDFLEKIE